jgi:hypothetical protein
MIRWFLNDHIAFMCQNSMRKRAFQNKSIWWNAWKWWILLCALAYKYVQRAAKSTLRLFHREIQVQTKIIPCVRSPPPREYNTCCRRRACVCVCGHSLCCFTCALSLPRSLAHSSPLSLPSPPLSLIRFSCWLRAQSVQFVHQLRERARVRMKAMPLLLSSQWIWILVDRGFQCETETETLFGHTP